ncbi:MAG: type II toxin-antitoxin system VapC family toxin [Beijerinckiaceae bacterium]
MLAVDTNVVIRYLVNDDPAQAARARKIIDSNDVFVPKTVLLEAEWVLRSLYEFVPAQIGAALLGFAGLPNVRIESEDAVARALAWYAAGLDFADAMHLASAEQCRSFVTFDKAFAKAAARITGKTIRSP